MKLTYNSHIESSCDFSNSIADGTGVRPRITGLSERNSENGTSVLRSVCSIGSGRGHPGIVRRRSTSGRAVEIQCLPVPGDHVRLEERIDELGRSWAGGGRRREEGGGRREGGGGGRRGREEGGGEGRREGEGERREEGGGGREGRRDLIRMCRSNNLSATE